MRPESKAILDKHRHHHDTLVKAQYVKHFNANERQELLQVARVEFFGAMYSPDLWCEACVSDFILSLYGRYDNWLKENSLDSLQFYQVEKSSYGNK